MSDEVKNMKEEEIKNPIDCLFDEDNTDPISFYNEKGEKVSLTGFGTFEVKERAERMGHNPRNGEAMKIPASKAPVFKAGKALKEAVAE